MTPLAASQRKRLPMLLLGATATLGFAVWNVHRALEPPLRSISSGTPLEKGAEGVEQSLPLPDAGNLNSTTGAVIPAPKAGNTLVVAEENMAPEANPFVPLPGQAQPGKQYFTAPIPQFGAMPQLPPPSYVPAPATPMRLTSSMSPVPARASQRSDQPNVSVRPTAPSSNAPVLPHATPVPGPQTERTAPTAEAPPALIGTLLGDQPSAVFLIEGNITIVPAGGLISGWQLLSVDHGKAVMKQIASGLKVPVLVASGTPGKGN